MGTSTEKKVKKNEFLSSQRKITKFRHSLGVNTLQNITSRYYLSLEVWINPINKEQREIRTIGVVKESEGDKNSQELYLKIEPTFNHTRADLYKLCDFKSEDYVSFQTAYWKLNDFLKTEVGEVVYCFGDFKIQLFEEMCQRNQLHNFLRNKLYDLQTIYQHELGQDIKPSLSWLLRRIKSQRLEFYNHALLDAYDLKNLDRALRGQQRFGKPQKYGMYYPYCELLKQRRKLREEARKNKQAYIPLNNFDQYKWFSMDGYSNLMSVYENDRIKELHYIVQTPQLNGIKLQVVGRIASFEKESDYLQELQTVVLQFAELQDRLRKVKPLFLIDLPSLIKGEQATDGLWAILKEVKNSYPLFDFELPIEAIKSVEIEEILGWYQSPTLNLSLLSYIASKTKKRKIQLKPCKGEKLIIMDVKQTPLFKKHFSDDEFNDLSIERLFYGKVQSTYHQGSFSFLKTYLPTPTGIISNLQLSPELFQDKTTLPTIQAFVLQEEDMFKLSVTVDDLPARKIELLYTQKRFGVFLKASLHYLNNTWHLEVHKMNDTSDADKVIRSGLLYHHLTSLLQGNFYPFMAIETQEGMLRCRNSLQYSSEKSCENSKLRVFLIPTFNSEKERLKKVEISILSEDLMVEVGRYCFTLEHKDSSLDYIEKLKILSFLCGDFLKNSVIFEQETPVYRVLDKSQFITHLKENGIPFSTKTKSYDNLFKFYASTFGYSFDNTKTDEERILQIAPSLNFKSKQSNRYEVLLEFFRYTLQVISSPDVTILFQDDPHLVRPFKPTICQNLVL